MIKRRSCFVKNLHIWAKMISSDHCSSLQILYWISFLFSQVFCWCQSFSHAVDNMKSVKARGEFVQNSLIQVQSLDHKSLPSDLFSSKIFSYGKHSAIHTCVNVLWETVVNSCRLEEQNRNHSLLWGSGDVILCISTSGTLSWFVFSRFIEVPVNHGVRNIISNKLKILSLSIRYIFRCFQRIIWWAWFGKH